MPADLEQGKILGSQIYGPEIIGITGTYDDVNRLCSEIADKYGWAFVNINVRPYYTEGAKTYGFEIAEQLGWHLPKHVVLPTAGGTLLPKVYKAFEECRLLGLVPESERVKLYSAQASGCAPVVNAIISNTETILPVKPNTIAKSIAIGNPADGYYAVKAVRESGGWGAAVTDAEVVEGIKLLAKTEGIFTEPAGGTTVAAAKSLIEAGIIPHDESVVIAITGNGLKTQEIITPHLPSPTVLPAKLEAFDETFERKQKR
jgi:threonine synthase